MAPRRGSHRDAGARRRLLHLLFQVVTELIFFARFRQGSPHGIRCFARRTGRAEILQEAYGAQACSTDKVIFFQLEANPGLAGHCILIYCGWGLNE